MSNRPRLKVPFQTVDVVLELISITLLLLIIGMTIYEYSSLPETIPTHFNAKGEADNFGHRMTVWWIPGIAVMMYIGLFIINRYPHMHNYMVNITPENALKNYRFSTRIVRIVNLYTLAIFGVICYTIIAKAKGGNFSLGTWFLPAIISSSVLLPIFVLVYHRKINKQS